MQAYTYISEGKFELVEKEKPIIIHERDAIVKVTLASICSSDIHIKHGSVPRAVPGITVGHEMVGIVESVGAKVTHVKPGDRVTVNVETFCGECFFCKKGFVNNCTDENGGWALGCRIDGGQAEYVRVPFADQGLNKIPNRVTDRQALLAGDVLATGFWAAKISEIKEEDTVLIIGAGPTGICTLLCVMLKKPKRIIVCEKDENRVRFIKEHYSDVWTVTPNVCEEFVRKHSEHGGADVVIEAAGADSTFRLAWECARPNAVVTVVAHLAKLQEQRSALEQLPPFTMDEIRKLAAQALISIPEKVKKYAPIVGVSYGRITIRNQRSRWGSCSGKGNLNFNCLLMLFPDDVIDYVVVHELCHRKYMNHSADFYAEVERVFPEYRRCQKWLKENGWVYISRLP